MDLQMPWSFFFPKIHVLTIFVPNNVNLLLQQHSVKELFQKSETKAVSSSHYHYIKKFEFYFYLS